MDYVHGYTLVNDMCSDLKIVALDGIDEAMMLTDLTVFTKRAATSIILSTDTFTAVGPYLVTKDEVLDPYNLMVWNSLSGVVREKATHNLWLMVSNVQFHSFRGFLHYN